MKIIIETRNKKVVGQVVDAALAARAILRKDCPYWKFGISFEFEDDEFELAKIGIEKLEKIDQELNVKYNGESE
jgi:hypothetical protein